MQKKALIIDDDDTVLDILAKYLAGHGFSVLTARNGKEGLSVLGAAGPDIVITDAEMPGMDGFAFCRKVKGNRATTDIPVIMMSGKKITERDLVSGYDTGADDYIIKPFSYPVLLAKVKAVLRRAKPRTPPAPVTIKKAGFELDMGGRVLKISGKQVKLTSKELDLFSILVSRSGRVVSLDQLLETVWGYDPARYNDPHTVEVHVYNLRKKLGPKLASRLKAVSGHGYKFE
ncbi:MAG: response regulator transcription factor [Elusimicrobiales bacterium]|jgi:DNA-binding response OmpR family regulator